MSGTAVTDQQCSAIHHWKGLPRPPAFPRHYHSFRIDDWPEELATPWWPAGHADTMCTWHTGVPICYWCHSANAHERKRGNPSAIFLMLGREELLPPRAHPSHGRSHPPHPCVQAGPGVTICSEFSNVKGDTGGLEFHNSASSPCCHFCLNRGSRVSICVPTMVQVSPFLATHGKFPCRVPSK